MSAMYTRRLHDDAVWESHVRGTGAFSKPGTLGAYFNDVNPLLDYVDYAIAFLWWCARAAYRRDIGARILALRANSDYSAHDLMRELHRLHVDYTALCCTNRAVYIAVGGKQANWAEYVLVRFLDGAPVPAWSDRRSPGHGARDRRPGRAPRPQRKPQGGRP